jgi:hypothetical protein
MPSSVFVIVVNSISARVSRGSARRHRERYDALSRFERDLYDADRFQFECASGGLGVFFTNSAGEHWRETIAALKRIGALRAHRVLVRACALFPSGRPSSNPSLFWEQANDHRLQQRLNKLGDRIDDAEIWTAMEKSWNLRSTSSTHKPKRTPSRKRPASRRLTRR